MSVKAALPALVSVLLAFFISITFLTISQRPQEYEERTLQLHASVLEIERRGQLTVELFGPFSILLAAQPFALLDVCSSALVIWLVIVICYMMLIRNASHVKKRLEAMLLLTVIYGSMVDGTQDHALVKAHLVGDACIFLAVLLASVQDVSRAYLLSARFLGAGEALALFGFGIGANFSDVKLAYLLLLTARIRGLSMSIADTKQSAAKLISKGVLNTLLHIILWPLLFLYLVGMCLPWSETAAGGNYNLRFFSPEARRDLSPFPAAGSSGIRIHSDKLYTLYVPGAGFLWSDDMVWEQRLPERLRHQANVQNEDDLDAPWSTDGSSRVYFDDRFGERYPWIIEQLNDDDTRSTSEVLHSNSRVRLYDPTAGRHLCMLPDNKITSEAVYFADDADADNKPEDRFRIGMVDDPSTTGCNWTFIHEAHSAGGFSLYNFDHSCHLASTFRPLPDFAAPYSNDTIISTLDLKLEASCTKSASVASSRLFIIDQLTERQSRPRDLPEDSWVHNILRAIDYFQARTRLSTYRERRDYQQEHPPLDARVSHWSWTNSSGLVCSIYLGLWLLESLAHRRRLLPSRKETSPYDLRAAFVVAHLCVNAQYNPRVVGLISLHGLIDAVSELPRLV